MSDELETQCWICPICFDDHRVNDVRVYCKADDLLVICKERDELIEERDQLKLDLAEMKAKYNFMVDSAQLNAKERDEYQKRWQSEHTKKVDAKVEVERLKGIAANESTKYANLRKLFLQIYTGLPSYCDLVNGHDLRKEFDIALKEQGE